MQPKIKLPTSVREIIATLKSAGYEAFAVGGSVRDLLLGKTTSGWDFTTNARPQKILELFPDSFYDNRFGTVGVKVFDKILKASRPVADKSQKSEEDINQDKPHDIYEITTYRSENSYSDFRHPDNIIWGDKLKTDLSRRDFTINAIATDGNSIIDPFSGQDDLKLKIIKTVGDPQARFSEDALRMLRAVRIAAQLGFTIDNSILPVIRRQAHLLKNISWERIAMELLKLLAADYPADGVLLLKNTTLLSLIIPELEAAFGVEQKSPDRHHVYDVGTHAVMALKHCPSKDPIVRLATLLHDIGKPPTMKVDHKGIITFYNHEVIGARMARNIAQRLRLSKKQTDKIFTLVRWHQFSVDERQTDSAIRRIIRRVGVDNLSDMLELRIGDRLGGGARETSWRLELFKKRLAEVQVQPFSITDLAIDGYDVMKELNCKPGPRVGQVLTEIFNEVESGSLKNDRQHLLQKLNTISV